MKPLSHGQEKRHTARVKARRDVTLSANLDAPDRSEACESSALRLTGYTRDLSEEGLSVILPSFPCESRELLGQKQPLTVTLQLASEQVTASAEPVRHAPLDERRPEQGSLMGLQITGMSEDDRQAFRESLRGEV